MDPSKKRIPAFLPAVVPALAALVFVVVHFLGGDADEAAATPAPPAKRDFTAARQLEADRWQAWRERLTPAVMDNAAERNQKEMSRTMSVLGTSPVELVDPKASGFVVIENDEDLKELLRNGGSYSGPLPDGFDLTASPAARGKPAAASAFTVAPVSPVTPVTAGEKH